MDIKDIKLGTVIKFTGTVTKKLEKEGITEVVFEKASTFSTMMDDEMEAAELVSHPRVTLTYEQREAVKTFIVEHFPLNELRSTACREIDSFAE